MDDSPPPASDAHTSPPAPRLVQASWWEPRPTGSIPAAPRLLEPALPTRECPTPSRGLCLLAAHFGVARASSDHRQAATGSNVLGAHGGLEPRTDGSPGSARTVRDPAHR